MMYLTGKLMTLRRNSNHSRQVKEIPENSLIYQTVTPAVCQ